MKSQRKPVEIFSFSFLDVIACGVGVILFITILSISQTVNQGDPELMEQLEASQVTAETLDRMARQLQENLQKQKDMQTAQAALAKLRAEVAALESKSTLGSQYEQLRQQYEVSKAGLEQMNNLAQTMPKRSPVARSTNKRPMVFLSFIGDDKVRIAGRTDEDFFSQDYEVNIFGEDIELTSKGEGQSVEALISSGGTLRDILLTLNQAAHYVECYVEPDAFEDFIKLRAMLQSAGWDVGFMFKSDTDTLSYGPSGTSSKVQ